MNIELDERFFICGIKRSDGWYWTVEDYERQDKYIGKAPALNQVHVLVQALGWIWTRQ